MNVGFVGLGIMGSRMAANLQIAGYELVVYNRSPEKAADLAAAGAVQADSPAAAARQVNILFTMLSTPEAVEEAATGEQGFLSSLQPGALWVDSSTVNPSFSRRMAAEASKWQVRFVDAPVSGSKMPAEKGQLLFLAGGSTADVQELQPLFDAMGRKTIHAGEAGMGSALKMVFNMLMGEAMLAFAESLVLGQSLGLEREMLFDVLLGTPLAPPFVATKREKIENGEYSPEFPIQWMQKDLQLASTSAYEQGVSLPGVNVAKEIYRLAMQSGLNGKDYSAIYNFLQQGLTV